MLDALGFALQLSSFSQIVGFRDPSSGLIIPPSIVCSDPDQIQRNATYEVMIRQTASQPFQASLGATGALGGTHQSSSNPPTQLGETQASFNARVGNLQSVIGSMPGINALPTPPLQSALQPTNGALGPSALTNEHSSQRDSQIAARGGNAAQNMIRDHQMRADGQYGNSQGAIADLSRSRQNGSGQAFAGFHSRQPSTAPAGVERERPTFQYTE